MVFVFRVLSLFPLRMLHALGAVLGRLVYWLSPTYRRHLRANLAQAGLGSSLRGRVAAETARHLALWMSYEDIIRVADLKTRASRFERVRREVGAKDGEPVVVIDFLKPGV